MSDQEPQLPAEGMLILAMLCRHQDTGNWTLLRKSNAIDEVLPAVLRALADSIEAELTVSAVANAVATGPRPDVN